MTRLVLPATVVMVVAWAGLAAAGARDGGLPLLLLVVAPTALLVVGACARSVVRRRTAALLGLGLGLWVATAWAWLRPLTVGVLGDGPSCGSALLPSSLATIDDASGCFSVVFDQFESTGLVALGAVVVSAVALCSLYADCRASPSVPSEGRLSGRRTARTR